jgi:DNA-directed RNA polymerase subunit RPC12/RpoP
MVQGLVMQQKRYWDLEMLVVGMCQGCKKEFNTFHSTKRAIRDGCDNCGSKSIMKSHEYMVAIRKGW